jgi:CBS domain-containing protein
MSILMLRTTSGSDLPIPGADPWHAARNDPALSVLTDFRERASVTVADMATIDEAIEHMKHSGVRCVVAIDETRHLVVGLITSYDIMGDKPMRYMQATGRPRHAVQVRKIMQAVAEWRVLDIKDIEQATVADVSELFDLTRLTHIPVMEIGERGAQRLRGLLSGSKLRRLLSK